MTFILFDLLCRPQNGSSSFHPHAPQAADKNDGKDKSTENQLPQKMSSKLVDPRAGHDIKTSIKAKAGTKSAPSGFKTRLFRLSSCPF